MRATYRKRLLSKKVKTAEMDELFHVYRQQKKNKIYLITLVDRQTRCILRLESSLGTDLGDHSGRWWMRRPSQNTLVMVWKPMPRFGIIWVNISPSEGKSDTTPWKRPMQNFDINLARLARASRLFLLLHLCPAMRLRLFVFCFNSRLLSLPRLSGHQKRTPVTNRRQIDERAEGTRKYTTRIQSRGPCGSMSPAGNRCVRSNRS